MVLRMKNSIILGVHWKIRLLEVEGFTKKKYRGEDCLKRGAWTVFWFKRGLRKKEGVVFLRGALILKAHYEEPVRVRSWKSQSSCISLIPKNKAKMKKFREVRVSSSKKIGWFDKVLPRTTKQCYILLI